MTQTPSVQQTYLFSIDVEDDRCDDQDWHEFSGRLPDNIDRYLDFLASVDMRCTFFVLGTVAQQYPEMVRKIAAQGHEVGCHSFSHLVLTKHQPASFSADLEKNLRALRDAGIGEISGFRAPCFSLTPQTAWAFEILHKHGFQYSSSVIPTWNPLFGWPGFSQAPVYREPGIWELPISLGELPGLRIPLAGGIYFRLLPTFIIRRNLKNNQQAGLPTVGYFHAHDIDTQQARDAFPEFKNKPLFNWLMFRNRGSVFKKLRGIIASGYHITRYDEFVGKHLKA